MTIGFIGLGAMGHHMATNLLRSGQPVHVWNRNPEPVQALAAKGAKPAATAAECGIAGNDFPRRRESTFFEPP